MKRILVTSVLSILGFFPAEGPKQFSDWSTPVKVDGINSPYLDSCVSISKNGMDLFFSSTRQSPGTTNRDLYMSKRESRNGAWGTPVPLTILNSSVFDSCPALSPDEHMLYFSSARPGCGGNDIWVAQRQDRRNNSLGWEWGEPVNLGCESDGYVNSTANDQTPALFEDEEGNTVLYFSSNRSGNWDHYKSVMRDDGTFGPASSIVELNSSYIDQGLTVSRNGLEVFFLSNRGGDHSSLDFYRATRTSTNEAWSDITFVPSLGDPALAQGRISLSFDALELYFTSYRDGNTDIWVATRERVHVGK